MKEFNERFLNEIAYFRRPVKEFIGGFSCKGEFGDLLEAFIESLGGVTGEEGGEKLLPTYSFLTKDEESFIEGYFLMLGKGDSASQNAYFSSVKGALEGYRKKSEEECLRYGDLYLKLGFLCGLMILVLII